MLEDDTGRCREPATEVDHIRALVDGGGDSPQNLRAICRWHHTRDTSAVANRHKVRHSKYRPEEKHPGLT